MAKVKNTQPAVPEAAQEEYGPQDVVFDPAQVAALPPELIGPENPAELLGCQDDEGEMQDDPMQEYAVTGCALLNLREAPGLDAPIVVALPRGVGVSHTGAVQGPWWEVSTGNLRGWVLEQYLEPVCS